MTNEDLVEDEQEDTAQTQTDDHLIDVHDLENLKKLWYLIRDAKSSEEIFTIIRLLLDSIPYDWLDDNDNWIYIAQQLEQFGEPEMASLFKLANKRCFELSFRGL